jgi:DNA-binding response OmpR family regulator
MTKQVLLVEDDQNILNSLAGYLSGEGYEVVPAKSIGAAKKAITRDTSIIILDWMLPDGTGLDYLKELRSSGNQTPIILLTAKNELIDKILGLESGANDYLTKPFEPRELLTRMRVRMREVSVEPTVRRLQFEEFDLNPQCREARFKDQVMDLTKLEFDLLRLLVEQPGRVFTREEILNKVWGFENFPTTRTVDNHIVQLRQKSDAGMFETVRGVGYRIVKGKR